jgi:hypothetical protein
MSKYPAILESAEKEDTSYGLVNQVREKGAYE